MIDQHWCEQWLVAEGNMPLSKLMITHFTDAFNNATTKSGHGATQETFRTSVDIYKTPYILGRFITGVESSRYRALTGRLHGV